MPYRRRIRRARSGCEMLSGIEQDRPQTVPSEKHEAAVERPKPLWLCCLDGGRWRTRTSEPRACEADPGVDCSGLHGTSLRNPGPVGTLEDSLGRTTAPKPFHELTA